MVQGKSRLPAVESNAGQKKYCAVRQFSAQHPAFSEPSLRWIVFNAEKNGLEKAGGVIRIGRKVLIEEHAFLRWVESGSRTTTAA